mgnify:CR=1 FL=1
MKKKTIVAVSGGFDPIHVGHIRLFSAAKKLGDELVVILNGDHWLTDKKGFVFMKEKERAEVLRGLRVVDRVIITRHAKGDADKSVSKYLARLKPDIFANGGDRKTMAHIPEAETCTKYGIKMMFGVGAGGKIQSSSWLTGQIIGKGVIDTRPWGSEEVLKSEPQYWVKTLTVKPGKRLSLQKHFHRSEVWVCVQGELTAELAGKKQTIGIGDVLISKKGETHRLSSKKGGMIVEVAFGDRVVEDDIVRLADDFGRR